LQRILFLFMCAKIEYVRIRTYPSKNRIRTLRILKPCWTHKCSTLVVNYFITDKVYWVGKSENTKFRLSFCQLPSYMRHSLGGPYGDVRLFLVRRSRWTDMWLTAAQRVTSPSSLESQCQSVRPRVRRWLAAPSTSTAGCWYGPPTLELTVLSRRLSDSSRRLRRQRSHTW